MAQGGGRKRIIGQRKANTKRPRFRRAVAIRRVGQPTHKRGMASLEVSGAEQVAAAKLADAARSLEDMYRDIMVPWFNHVESEWPVRTGFSKGALQIRAEEIDGRVVMTIANLASYAFYIRSGRKKPRNVAKRLVWDPAKELAPKMAEYIARHIGD